MYRIAYAAAAAVAGVASASPVVDQEYAPVDAVPVEATQASWGLTQSFKQSSSTTITGAGFLLGSWNVPQVTVTIGLYASAANARDNANALATATISAPHSSWAEVFWGEVAVTPGATYFLNIRSDSTIRVLGTLDSSALDPYLDGQAYVGTSAKAWDFAFRTYTLTAVPAPAAAGLGGLGLCTVACRRRRA